MNIGFLNVPKIKEKFEFDDSLVTPTLNNVDLKEYKFDEFSGKEIYVAKRIPKCVKLFENVDKAGTEASYRCIRCRGCSDCTKSEMIECISL